MNYAVLLVHVAVSHDLDVALILLIVTCNACLSAGMINQCNTLTAMTYMHADISYKKKRNIPVITLVLQMRLQPNSGYSKS